MLKDQLNEILDFAIDREKEAVKFYQDLQKMVKFKNQRDLFEKFENMEKGHVKKITEMKTKEIGDISLKKVNNLKISDYLVEVKPTSEMDYQDILIVAMKREEAANNLYKDLASKIDDEDAKKLFTRLAQEEAGHKFTFEKMYDKDILTEN